MFLDELFNGYNPGAFEGGMTDQSGFQLGEFGLPQYGRMGVFGQNQLGGYQSPLSGGLGMTNYATSPLVGANNQASLLTGGDPMAKPSLGMLGRTPMQIGTMRDPRMLYRMRQMYSPMMLGRMRVNAY